MNNEREPHDERLEEELEGPDFASEVSRREFLRQSASVGVSLAMVGGLGAPAGSRLVAASRAVRAAKPKRGGTITCSEAGAPSGYDIKWWNDPIDFPHASIFEQLVQEDPFTGKLEPQLATAMPAVTKGGTLYTYKLRRGIQFHKGFGEMTSEDVVWSWERLMSPELNANGSYIFTVLPIVGLKPFLNKRAAHITGLRAVDRYTVELELEHPDSQTVPTLTYYLASIFSKKAYEQMGAKQWNWTPVATGPFELQKANPATGATLVRHTKYWQRNLPYVDRVVIPYNVDSQLALLRIESNKQDMMFENVPTSSINQLLADPTFKNRIFRGTGGDPIFLSLPTKIKPFDDLRVRKAIAMAIDKEKMARVLKGSALPASGGFLPPHTPWYQPNLSYGYDLQKAKQLLASAGQESGFTADLLTQNISPWLQMAESIQGDLAQLGVKVNVKPMAPGQFDTQTNTLGNRLPMIIWDWGAQPTAASVFDSAFTTSALKSGCCNYPRYSNPKLDALIAKVHAVSLAQSVGVCKEAERMVVRDLALWVPLLYLRDTQLIAERIRGYRVANFIGGTRKLFQYYSIA
jgi:peptide/nickel transport system substrate-binding protein